MFKFQFFILNLPLSIMLKVINSTNQINQQKDIHSSELEVRQQNCSHFLSPEINVSIVLSESIFQSNYLISKMLKFANSLSSHKEWGKYLNTSFLQGYVCVLGFPGDVKQSDGIQTNYNPSLTPRQSNYSA